MSNTVLKYILNSGEVKALDTVGDAMEIEGWASTKDIDYEGDIVAPSAFAKHLDQYSTKGRYWFNHDPQQVLGKVLDAEVNSNGLYIKKARLSDTKINKDYFWPLIKEGALNEHSIQFFSHSPERIKGGGWLHNEVEIIETSVVSVACNAGAIITGVKSLMPAEDYHRIFDTGLNNTEILEAILNLHKEHKLLMPSDLRKNFYVSGTKSTNEDNNIQTEDMTTADQTADATQGLTPDFSDFKYAKSDLTEQPDAEGLPVPKKSHKDFATICDAIYIGKSAIKNCYLFRVGVPTEKGFKYDFNAIALSLGDVLGAKGQYILSDETKAECVSKLVDLYAKFNKTVPTFDETPLNKLTCEAVKGLTFDQVTFHEGEQELISIELLKRSTTAATNAYKFLVKSDTDEAKEAVKKYLYANVSVSLTSYDLEDEGEIAFIQSVLDSLTAYKAAEEEAEQDLFSYALYLTETTKKDLEETTDVVAEEVATETTETAEEVVVEEVTEDAAPEDELTEEQLEEIKALINTEEFRAGLQKIAESK